MPVALNAASLGDTGPAVVILHGLLGSSRNWTTVARDLAEDCRVHALDLRNHGASPHTGPFSYDDLVDDVRLWIETHLDAPVTLIGHSLGGKTAMLLACRHAALVDRLVVVDASPCAAPQRWEAEFRAMRALDLSTILSRQQAETFLEQQGIDDWALRKFLTSNIDRNADGTYAWKINLEALHQSLPRIFETALGEGDHYADPTLLIRGGESQFVPDDDLPALRGHFPRVRVETLAGAGHNVHADAPRPFITMVRTFLQGTGAME